ncbi:MAG: Rrf2 family transcriptional regulator [Bacteroidales bacterium]|nr:Rrf2 family transcriptional regulator [Bacteroidales bacterium]
MAKVINLSEAASLAIHSMALIAGSKIKLNVGNIAAITGASRNHLAKVLQTLVRHDYLISDRGPKGGFELKHDASQITLLEIYQTMEGIIDRNYCGLHGTTCPFAECVFGGLTQYFTNDFVNYMQTKKLSSIAYKTQI